MKKNYKKNYQNTILCDKVWHQLHKPVYDQNVKNILSLLSLVGVLNVRLHFNIFLTISIIYALKNIRFFSMLAFVVLEIYLIFIMCFVQLNTVGYESIDLCVQVMLVIIDSCVR